MSDTDRPLTAEYVRQVKDKMYGRMFTMLRYMQLRDHDLVREAQLHADGLHDDAVAYRQAVEAARIDSCGSNDA